MFFVKIKIKKRRKKTEFFLLFLLIFLNSTELFYSKGD